MKSKFLLYLVLVCAPLLAWAQTDSLDVIYLKDGSIYRGVILERLPNKSYRIEITGKNIIAVKAADIDHVAVEPLGAAKANSTDSDDVIYLKNGAVYVGEIFENKAGLYYKIEMDNRRISRADYDEVLKIDRVPVGSVRIHAAPRKPSLLNIETGASYMLCFAVKEHGTAISQGCGASFLLDIHKEKSSFSLLIGAAVQFAPIRDFQWQDNSYNYGAIDKGYMTRIQVPLWCRWTFKTKTPVFFQFGLGIGGNLYQGKGSLESDGPHGVPQSIIKGWQKYLLADVNVLPMGVGIRKQLRPHLELITYVELAPCNLQAEYDGGNVYLPYCQLHLGFNFGTSRHKTETKRP